MTSERTENSVLWPYGKPGSRGSARRTRKRTLPRFDPEKTRLEVKAILHALDDLRPSRAY